MKSTVEALEGNKVKVVVEVEESEFERDIDAAFKRLAQEVRLPGFRPGKAPRKVLEARIGPGYARDEAFREALPNYYSEAVKEHEVDVIAPPEIDITNGREEGPVTFDAVVEVRPSISVEGYEGLEVEIPPIYVPESDIDDRVEQLARGFGELVAVDRAGTTGDRAVIDIETLHEGEEVAGFTTEGYVYEIGSGATGVDAIDEHLEGASAGDHLNFEAPHPDEDEDEPLVFTIEVTEIQEMVLPEPTDEWVAENTEFETLDEMRGDYRKNMETAKINQANVARRNGVMDQLAALVDDELVPDAMVDMEVEHRAQDMALRLQAQNIDLGTFLQITGQSQEDFLADLRGDASTSAKIDLALRAVAETEALDVAEDDLEEQFAQVAAQVGRSVDEVRDDFVQAGRMSALRSDLLKGKALDWITDRAKLVDEDGQQVSADALQLPDEDETSDGADDEEAPEPVDVGSGEDEQ